MTAPGPGAASDGFPRIRRKDTRLRDKEGAPVRTT